MYGLMCITHSPPQPAPQSPFISLATGIHSSEEHAPKLK